MIQSNLKALVDVAVQELGDSADLTLSPRVYLSIIGRGDPVNLNVPRNSTMLLFCPKSADAGDLWVPVLVQTGTCHALLDKAFVARKLKEELTALFTADDIKSRNSSHDLREVWVRRDLSAAVLCPTQFPPRSEAPRDPILIEAEAQMAARQVRVAAREKGKVTAKRSTDAIAFNKKSAEKFAEQQAARRAREPRAK